MKNKLFYGSIVLSYPSYLIPANIFSGVAKDGGGQRGVINTK